MLHCYKPNKENGWPGVEYAKFSVRFGSDAYNIIPAQGSAFELVLDRFGKIANQIPFKNA